jgi:hypothetical protein
MKKIDWVALSLPGVMMYLGVIALYMGYVFISLNERNGTIIGLIMAIAGVSSILSGFVMGYHLLADGKS